MRKNTRAPQSDKIQNNRYSENWKHFENLFQTDTNAVFILTSSIGNVHIDKKHRLLTIEYKKWFLKLFQQSNTRTFPLL